MTDVNVVSDNSTTAPVLRFRDAYQRIIDEVNKVPASELIPINIDIPAAVATALGAMPEIMALRSKLVALPDFDIARLDKLETYTLAIGHAHTRWLGASTPAESLEQISQDATVKRELLLSDAVALAKRNMVDGQRLKELKGPIGFKNLSFDLFNLADMLRSNWSAISGKSALQLAELDQAEVLADRLITAVGLREQGPAVVAETAESRQRAFALFVSAYDQVRRAVSYLRWNEDDVDNIVPSLYAGRTTGRKKTSTEVKPPIATTPATPSAPSAPAPSPVTNGSAAVAPVRSVGLPQSEPFVGR